MISVRVSIRAVVVLLERTMDVSRGVIGRLIRPEDQQPVNSNEGSMQPEIELTVEELEERIAPTILLTNPGGNQPQGEGAENGKAIDYENPAGHAPPGWNK